MHPHKSFKTGTNNPYLYQFFYAAFFMILSLSFISLDHSRSKFTSHIRMAFSDTLSPFLSFIGKPIALSSHLITNFQEIIYIQTENEQLKQENELLKQSIIEARHIQAENKVLRKILNFNENYEFNAITSRVIVDSFGAYVRSLLIDAGKNKNIRKGNAVVSHNGLVGRVVEVGNNSSRILLMTDLNSRVPVIFEKERYRAILAGNNTDRPQLIYTPDSVDLTPGMRLTTSGDGNTFPAGLPVGVIVAIKDNSVWVQPFANWNRLEYVTVMTNSNKHEVSKENEYIGSPEP